MKPSISDRDPTDGKSKRSRLENGHGVWNFVTKFLAFLIVVSSNLPLYSQRQHPYPVLQLGQPSGINAVALSHNLKLALTASFDNTVKLWDVSSGWEIRQLRGHSEAASLVKFSSNDRYGITAGEDSTARIWNLSTGAEIHRIEIAKANNLAGEQGKVYFASFLHSDKEVIIARMSGSIEVFSCATWKVIRRMSRPISNIDSADLSPDGHWLAVADGQGELYLWDVNTGKRHAPIQVDGVKSLTDPQNVAAVNFSADSSEIAVSTRSSSASSVSGFVWLYSSPNLSRVGKIDVPAGAVSSQVLSSHEVVVGGSDGGVTMWRRDSLESIRTLVAPTQRMLWGNVIYKGGSLALSQDEKLILAGSFDGIARLIDTRTGLEVQDFQGRISDPRTLAVSTDGKYLSSGDPDDGTIRTWDLSSGSILRIFQTEGAAPFPANNTPSIAFSRDNKMIVAGLPETTRAAWTIDSGESVTPPPILMKDIEAWKARVTSANGDFTIYSQASETAHVLKGEGAIEVFQTPRQSNRIDELALSRDGQLALTGEFGGPVKIWDVRLRRLRVPLSGFAERGPFGAYKTIMSPVFSPNGSLIAGAINADPTVYIWDSRTGLLKASLTGHLSQVNSISFGDNEDTLFTASDDGTVRVWSISKKLEIAKLVASSTGTWTVTDSTASFFDGSTLENDLGVHWLFPDDPFHPLPLEIFMRDYYEPRLLPRLLKCKSEELKHPGACTKEFKSVRPLAGLNRVQPKVTIKAEWQDAAAGIAKVTVVVCRNFDPQMQNGKTSTDPYDLRLFRDGQLVGWAPKTSVEWQLEPPATGRQADKLDLDRWRKKTHVDLDESGNKELPPFFVQVPRRDGVAQVTFTAYAFNEDRVKSVTASSSLKVDTPLITRKGKAYVISVGVNRTESLGNWDLNYAANDARQMSQVVGDSLKGTKQFSEVVGVRLVSDAPDQQQPGEAVPTKAHLQAVLDVLAGREVPKELKDEISGIEKMDKAQPEDLVLLSFSSHGYTDRRGVFHIVLWDIGEDTPQDRITPELQSQSLSSDVLSGWLRDVDAGEVTMIVDSCHSEATVAAEGFKPGPMGSRGLGQLAYDKGMRILAASKSNEEATELGGTIKQGLLSYALTEEGLVEGRAAKDGKVLMAGWLSYGEQEVPNLYRAGMVRGPKGERPLAANGRDIIYLGQDQVPQTYQQPVLFDFNRSRSDTLISVR